MFGARNEDEERLSAARDLRLSETTAVSTSGTLDGASDERGTPGVAYLLAELSTEATANPDSLGVDIEEVGRLRRLYESGKSEVLKSIFGETELAVAAKKGDPGRFLAGRFVAKEATVKALPGTPLTLCSLPDIVIRTTGDGSPVVTLPKSLDAEYDLAVSIAHTDQLAVAVVACTARNGDTTAAGQGGPSR